MVRKNGLRIVLAASIVLTGCSALIGVNDIFLDDASGSGDGGPGHSEASTSDSPISQGDGGDAGTCPGANLMTDKLNCGACGHGCLGGDCTGGKCQAFELGSITTAPLFAVQASSDSVFVSTVIGFTTQAGGIWRVGKAGGSPELYVNKRYAEGMAVLGTTLYFVVDDDPGDAGTGGGGGLYSCPVSGAAPCAPTLIASAVDPRSVVASGGKIYYGDANPAQGGGNGVVLVYDPSVGGKPTIFRNGYGFAGQYAVDGTSAFYSVTVANNPPYDAKVFEIYPDGGDVTLDYDYSSNSANDGTLRVAPLYMLFAAYDFESPAGGVVTRITRPGGPGPCNYGGTTNKRPFGVVEDTKKIYWTNQGIGDTQPFTGGSVSSCDFAGCCTSPDVLWTAIGQPTAITDDDTAVYWVTSDLGAVWKIAKP